MVKCANCAADADYTYAVTPSNLINYCEAHVPNFLKGRKASGQLALVPVQIVVEAPVEEVPTKSSKKKAAEPVVEETPVEPEVDAPTESEAE